MPKAKVVHLSSAHEGLDIRIFHKEAISLAKAGYEVALIAPDLPQGPVHGVKLISIKLADKRLERFVLSVWQVYRLALKEKADLYHFHDPELIPIALLLRLAGKKVIYDVHEDLPKQVNAKFWIPSMVRQGVAWLVALGEGLAANLLTGIVAATPFIAERFPKHKTVIVHNFPILSELRGAKEIPYSEKKPWLIYVGGISGIRGGKEMIAATNELAKDKGIRLQLAGDFSQAEFKEELEQMPGWEYVDFWGWQARPELAALLQNSKVGLVVLHPTPNYVESYPIKLFEYMAAGIPVVASNFPLWREIVQKADSGLLVDPLNVSAISEAVHYILEHPEEAEAMGQRGKAYVEEHYNWQAEEETLVKFYTQVLGGYYALSH